MESPDEVFDFPAGEHGKVCNGLRSGGVVVEHHQHAGRRRSGGRDSVGHLLGRDLELRGKGGQNVCFKGTVHSVVSKLYCGTIFVRCQTSGV